MVIKRTIKKFFIKYINFSNKHNPLINSLKKDVKSLKKENKKNNKKIAKLEKSNKKLTAERKTYEKTFDSYNFLFNNIYLDFELKPKGFLATYQKLCLEMLDFIDNICNKYDIEYWLDAGNVLGAYRHGAFLPWDDDIDIAIMREEYFKLSDALKKEIELNGLSDNMFLSEIRLIDENIVYTFPQLIYSCEDIGIDFLASVDFFQFDYISEFSEDLEAEFKREKAKFFMDIINSLDKDIRDEIKKEDVKKVDLTDIVDVRHFIQNSYESLNLTFEKQDHLIQGVDGNLGGGVQDFSLFKSEDFFPLDTIEFCGKEYPCENNVPGYLAAIYDENFRKIPRIVRHHSAQSKLRDREDIIPILESVIERMREVNKNFN